MTTEIVLTEMVFNDRDFIDREHVLTKLLPTKIVQPNSMEAVGGSSCGIPRSIRINIVVKILLSNQTTTQQNH